MVAIGYRGSRYKGEPEGGIFFQLQSAVRIILIRLGGDVVVVAARTDDRLFGVMSLWTK